MLRAVGAGLHVLAAAGPGQLPDLRAGRGDHCRGRGLGRWLVGEAERRARTAGATRIEVSSAGHRKDAHKLYRECGFEDGSVRLVKRFGDA
ncbi:GNAT family N-acetyltransferase [Alkalisalibacterium limincola]|uniref:GNAT family N-acetyltransferase n=1 Tax=Alkalisalibacterium limincola TaxID=2699169 RepID=UPI002106140D|nr:GNAT family N-acetyltransferase [Alkalisalibacterium limincola]